MYGYGWQHLGNGWHHDGFGTWWHPVYGYQYANLYGTGQYVPPPQVYRHDHHDHHDHHDFHNDARRGGGRPAPPSMDSWRRWQKIHPGTPYSDFTNWWQQHGQYGAQIS